MFENLVEGNGVATIFERDEDEVDAIPERIELIHFFC